MGDVDGGLTARKDDRIISVVNEEEMILEMTQ